MCFSLYSFPLEIFTRRWILFILELVLWAPSVSAEQPCLFVWPFGTGCHPVMPKHWGQFVWSNGKHCKWHRHSQAAQPNELPESQWNLAEGQLLLTKTCLNGRRSHFSEFDQILWSRWNRNRIMSTKWCHVIMYIICENNVERPL